jgi:hypothetical protein
MDQLLVPFKAFSNYNSRTQQLYSRLHCPKQPWQVLAPKISLSLADHL